MFWGYSLAYSRTASPFIGDMANFGLKNVMSAPSPGSALLPEIVFCLYQMLFCACTVQLVIGGSFERGRILPSMIFAFCWATIVYCPIACWTWNVSRATSSHNRLDADADLILGQRLAFQPPVSRLRWRWSSPHRIRMVCPGVCLRPR
jgi:ammonia channel protein AmtB